ncbi:TonB-dependent receptor [Fodinibius saliphilus]|uniref:TonB-dependent receptor n=1 Tax=Fodinibius saliphilus TaxID=1920650 RepID=UPI001108843D|nr:TonB-dependent receptor [Fodinibius saliphilus]
MYFKLIRATAFLCFLMAMSTTLVAQTITGMVIDAQSNEPLPGANIIQLDTKNGISADENGAFTLSLKEGASSKIKVTFVGFKSKTIDTTKRGGELTISLVPNTVISNEVFVKALRVDEASPMAFDNVSRTDIEKKNLGQDMPYMMSSSPSVTTTSDAGSGVGYTGMRIRGVDQGRINVTINGIPLNDAESHGVYWVDIPDLASSVENIQIQRGVGTSTNGAAAFGATVNVQTSQMRSDAYGEVNTGIGSFDTKKANVMLGSGLMENGWQFEGRLSKITSDGYIDRASSDLKSFYLSAAKHGERSLLRADVFSGKEKTYHAWNGVSESKLENGERTYNSAGTEKPGTPYKDQTDNYQQDHYQLHYFYDLAKNWNVNASLHYTYGRGYYEQYKADEELGDYSISPVIFSQDTVSESDLVRRKWLDNHFYGTVFSTEYNIEDKGSITLGGGYNEYDGDHFGEVIWGEYLGNTNVENRYYDNNGFKTDFNTYLKGQYNITEALTIYADAQIRRVTYKFLGKDRIKNQSNSYDIVDVKQTDELTFFNPKAGLTYNKGNHRAYFSFSMANKEPTRDEYVDSTPESRPEHETLYDWEAGYKASFERFFVSANLYFMDYKNQLILTGQINDIGSAIRQNVDNSYRAGIELQAGANITNGLEWSGNATISRNKIDEYNYYLTDYSTNTQKVFGYQDTDISFSPDFIGNSIIQFNREGFTAQLTTKYVSRQYLDNTQTKSRSLDPYLVNDLRVAYEWSKASLFKGITATLEVNNLLDEKYESNGYTFGLLSQGSQQHYNYYYPQAGRNFMLQLSFTF